MELGVAFYRGPGGFIHWLIRNWTRSDFTHVELTLPDADGHLGIRPWEDGVRSFKPLDLEHWEIISFKADVDQVMSIQRFYERTRGQTYDWLGVIFNHITPFQIKQVGKWYCSEWVAHALDYAGVLHIEPHEYRNPGLLFEAVKERRS